MEEKKPEVQRQPSSSAEESILSEQIRKLFQLCDREQQGVVGKRELLAIFDLIPQKQMAELEKIVAERYIDEKEFSKIMQGLVAEDSRGSSSSTDGIHAFPNNGNSPQGFGEGVSLADELEEIAKTQEILSDPLTDMIRAQLEDNSYPYVVTNSSMPTGPLPMRSMAEPVIIKRAHFRPIEHDTRSYAVGVQSLADELAEAEMSKTNQSTPETDLRTPDRIFKVVFVGDSAVGKTCFLHRFCHNRFKPLFNATIGVDFTVKTIQLKERIVALQLWDTAGQERFRAITKQYFRKADGVILMFDVTSEQSLLNVRNWVDSVRAGVDESTVLCLVGNKVDLFGSDFARNSVYRAGKKLAEEFGMSFFETSAFTGYGIETCMRCIAERLQQREEKHLEEALRLEMTVQEKKRSWCCV